ncbi:hypothetical protein GGX14DRAFT_608600 [Mycena pura]|uniref:Uncharacterized protein n=1 Tax=Mycena pura TaxID=153505 RepID=A0AAD6YEQ7_9AGAR|nr:hypothetical protein GGX14DRAFT_608600 [Mycena pura]
MRVFDAFLSLLPLSATAIEFVCVCGIAGPQAIHVIDRDGSLRSPKGVSQSGQKTTQITSYPRGLQYGTGEGTITVNNPPVTADVGRPKPEAIRVPQPQASGGQALQLELSAFNLVSQALKPALSSLQKPPTVPKSPEALKTPHPSGSLVSQSSRTTSFIVQNSSRLRAPPQRRRPAFAPTKPSSPPSSVAARLTRPRAARHTAAAPPVRCPLHLTPGARRTADPASTRSAGASARPPCHPPLWLRQFGGELAIAIIIWCLNTLRMKIIPFGRPRVPWWSTLLEVHEQVLMLSAQYGNSMTDTALVDLMLQAVIEQLQIYGSFSLYAVTQNVLYMYEQVTNSI